MLAPFASLLFLSHHAHKEVILPSVTILFTGCSSLSELLDRVGVLKHGVMHLSQRVGIWNSASSWVCSEGSSEEEDEGFWFVDLVVDPATGLLHSKLSPLLLEEQAVPGHLSVCVLGEEYVSVLVLIVLVLFGVLDLFWEVRHL